LAKCRGATPDHHLRPERAARTRTGCGSRARRQTSNTNMPATAAKVAEINNPEIAADVINILDLHALSSLETSGCRLANDYADLAEQ